MAPPRKDTLALTLRVYQSTIDRIDALRQQVKNPPSRPEMIRRILEEWLENSDGTPPAGDD